MWLLPSVDQVVFLQVSQLSETFATGLTFERSLPTVDAKMNLCDKKRKKTRLYMLKITLWFKKHAGLIIS